MEVVIFVGLQGAGKTTFYHQRFASTHIRISLDQLGTRAREMAALRTAMEAGQNIVIDNTNPTVANRKKYLDVLLASGWWVVAYYFEPDIPGSIKRNALRTGKERIPRAGLFATRKRMQPPTRAEGFNECFAVRVQERGEFEVSLWPDSPRSAGAPLLP